MEIHSDSFGNTKIITTLASGFRLETAILSMGTYSSVCLSTQAGCARACAFCATGNLGLERNLRTAEIVDQFDKAAEAAKKPLRNIVFMGMGEPLDNLEAVQEAVAQFADPRGRNIPASRITLSTAGNGDGIRSLARWLRKNPQWANMKLAVSLNAPDDEIRSRLMPINDRWPLTELFKAIGQFPLKKTRSRILLEYIVIPGINDLPGHAKKIAALASGGPFVLNIIPYNGHASASFANCDEDRAFAFLNRLKAKGLSARLRLSKGRDLEAACGQLGGRPPNR